jgi:large subunit ribosomal protein L4
MTKVKVFNLEGKEVDQIELNPDVFGVEINTNLVSQAIRVQEANARQVLAHTKTRANVRGGGKKPWKQKGTGRARAGSSRSPLWKGGGVTFGPLNIRNFSLNINKKQKRKALKMSLSDKLADNRLIVVDSLDLQEGKTKELVQALGKLQVNGSALLTTAGTKQAVVRASGNIQKVDAITANSLNVRDIISHTFLIVEKDGIKEIEETFNK